MQELALPRYHIEITRDGYYLGMPEHPASITCFALPRHLFYEKMTPLEKN